MKRIKKPYVGFSSFEVRFLETSRPHKNSSILLLKQLWFQANRTYLYTQEHVVLEKEKLMQM